MKKNNYKNKNSAAKKVALSGLMGAVMITIMLLGSILPMSTYCAPAFAGICFIPIIMEYGYKTPLLLYIAISILSILFIPQKEMALFFVCIFGYYPILRVALQKIHNKIVRWGVKLIVFNASLAIIYLILFFIFTTSGARQAFTQLAWWLIVIYAILYNLIFIIYDILIDRLNIIYMYKLRKYFF